METFTAIFEILLLWLIFYQLYLAFKDSRGVSILVGLVGLILVGGVLLELFRANVLKYILSSSLAIGTILAVVFQPELRAALAKIGTNRFFMRLWNREESEHFVDDFVDAVSYLASRRYGALFVICRSNRLDDFADSGVPLDALFSRELVGSIFMPQTPLHDGAVIIHNKRIISAAAILPVSSKEIKDRSMGLRHRAGIGAAEESDAVVVIVSEETGAVSIVFGNMIERNVDMTYLNTRLTELLTTHENEQKN